MNKLLIIFGITILLTFQVCAKEQPSVRPAPNLADFDIELAIPSKITTPLFPHRKIDKSQGGWVHSVFKLKSNGKPIDVRIIDSSPKKILDKSVKRALKKWHFHIPHNHSEEREYQYLLELKYE